MSFNLVDVASLVYYSLLFEVRVVGLCLIGLQYLVAGMVIWLLLLDGCYVVV